MNPETIQSLLALPTQTLAVLGGGYLAYRMAYVGRNAAHQGIDLAMIVLAFGLVVQLVGTAGERIPGNLEWVMGIVVALVMAALWRSVFSGCLYSLLRAMGVSDHDGQPSAWASLLSRTDLKGATRLIVTMDHGVVHMCDPLVDFERAPMGPCILGEDGSIGMYVTHSCGADCDDWVEQTPSCESYGELMTFIPADRVRLIEIQRQR